jgi:hypothetical protein
MSKPLSSTALAAGILLLSVGTPDAQAKQECRAEIPARQHGYWSYRLIDGRKCWYEGKPGLSKSLLEWPKEEAKTEAKAEPRQEPKKELKQEPREAQKEALKQEPKPAPRQELKPELKPTPKSELKSELKPELKDAQKEEAFARPAFRTKRETVAAEKPQDPFDAQAWAQEDSPTFEALWRSRAQSFR